MTPLCFQSKCWETLPHYTFSFRHMLHPWPLHHRFSVLTLRRYFPEDVTTLMLFSFSHSFSSALVDQYWLSQKSKCFTSVVCNSKYHTHGFDIIFERLLNFSLKRYKPGHHYWHCFESFLISSHCSPLSFKHQCLLPTKVPVTSIIFLQTTWSGLSQQNLQQQILS